jgi:predicted RNA binding protein YcfA (HicA-like mRNA interferase family)
LRLPRDIAGQELAKRLSLFGYLPSRQTGSHIRLTTMDPSQHHITIPAHSHLRVGTLSSILTEVAAHVGITKEQVAERLFGM